MSPTGPGAAQAFIELTNEMVTFNLKPRGGPGRYTLSCSIEADENQPANSGLITVAFVGPKGQWIDNPLGWSVSPSLGIPFRYFGALKRGPNRYALALTIDETVAEVSLGLRAWLGGSGLRISPMELRKEVAAAASPSRPAALAGVLSPDGSQANRKWPEAMPQPVNQPLAKNAARVVVPSTTLVRSEQGTPEGEAAVVLRVAAGEASVRHSYVVEPGHKYALRAVVAGDRAMDKALLLKVAFEGPSIAAGTRAEGLSFSDRHGLFSYLSVGPNSLRFVAPEGANKVHVEAISWSANSGAVSIDARLTVLAVPEAVRMRHLEAAVDRIADLARRADSCVVIYTGTKRIGEGGRANRSMMFARELERLGVPTVYAYVPSEDDVGVQPDEGCLLQVPIDQFDRVAARLASEVDGRRRVLIGSMPDINYCRLVGLFRHRDWRVVYEARDDWSEFAGVGAAKWYAEIFERFAVAQAEKVFCVSPPLVRSMARFTDDPAKVFLSPNGTTEDFIAFGKVARAERRHQGLRQAAGRRPIVGYFGHLTEQWFDWDALRAAARELPEIDFRVIGFDMPALSLPDNIAYLGSMSHEQIRAEATEWAVAMIPFRHGKLSRAVDPIKIYEYLSLGLKVVACPMGTIKSYPLTFCYDEFGLVDALRDALSYIPTERDYEAIDAVLAGASWKSRLLDMLAKSGVHLDDAAVAGAV